MRTTISNTLAMGSLGETRDTGERWDCSYPHRQKRGESKGYMRSLVFAAFLAGILVFSSTSAEAQDLLPRDNGIFTYHEPPRWRESEVHPLRITGYLLHPVGWLAREGVGRPLSSFIASTQFTRSFFGFREPYSHREPVCYDASGAVPDCRSVPPYSNLASIGSASVPPVVGSIDSSSSASSVSERQVFFPDIAFEYNKSDLNHLGKGRVRQIAQLLASVPALNVVIEGHADPRGTEEYNEKLGAARAQSVVNELVELGIDPERLSGVSYGEGRPIFSEDTEWAYAVNRRVQFSVGGAAPEGGDAAVQ